MPREMRTPKTEAFKALHLAVVVFESLFCSLKANQICDPKVLELEDAYECLANKIFQEAWGDPRTCGDKEVNEMGELAPSASPIIKEIAATVAYSAQAMQLAKSGKDIEAWKYVSDAQFWAGIMCATWETMRIEEIDSELVRKAISELNRNYAQRPRPLRRDGQSETAQEIKEFLIKQKSKCIVRPDAVNAASERYRVTVEYVRRIALKIGWKGKRNS